MLPDSELPYERLIFFFVHLDADSGATENVAPSNTNVQVNNRQDAKNSQKQQQERAVLGERNINAVGHTNHAAPGNFLYF